MVSLNFVLLVLLLPSIVLMAILTDGKTRLRLAFMAFGFIAAFFSGQINSFISTLGGITSFDLSIHVSPIVEELIKAFPLVVLIFVVNPDRRSILEYAVWIGIGFAFFENVCAYASVMSWVPSWEDVSFALSRGFGASLVHSLCTYILIYGILICKKQRKLLVTGSFALFSLVCMIHSTFNVLIQSRYAVAPFLLTLGIYVTIAAVVRAKKKKGSKRSS